MVVEPVKRYRVLATGYYLPWVPNYKASVVEHLGLVYLVAGDVVEYRARARLDMVIVWCGSYPLAVVPAAALAPLVD